jgi:hypothetical protein
VHARVCVCGGVGVFRRTILSFSAVLSSFYTQARLISDHFAADQELLPRVGTVRGIAFSASGIAVAGTEAAAALLDEASGESPRCSAFVRSQDANALCRGAAYLRQGSLLRL